MLVSYNSTWQAALGKGCSEGWMKSWGGRRGNPSQKLILAKMHSLDYVSAVVEHPSNVLRIYCACEVWITVVFTISGGCADSLQKEKLTITNYHQIQVILKRDCATDFSQI